MKKVFLLIITSCLALGIYAQNVLDTRLDYTAQNLPISKALENLSKQSKVNLTFSSNFFKRSKRVSIQVKKERLETILRKMLADTGTNFKVIENHVVLFKIPPRKLQNFTISGYLSDLKTRERLVAANVYCRKHATGTVSNEYGFFSMTLPEGETDLLVSYLGYGEWSNDLSLDRDIQMNISLAPSVTLAEIIVTPKDSLSQISKLSGEQKIAIPQAQSMPDLGGESDIIRMIHLLPGVQSGVDGFGGMYVRGGNVDQNLMLVDGVPVYNAAHLFGMFSIYNTDAIRSATFLKGGFPARYGGRISSVFDVRTKEGNQNRFSAEAGIGLVSGKLRLEMPLFNKNGALLVAGRSTHTDFFTKSITTKLFQIQGDSVENHFRDLNFKFNYSFSDKDRIFLSFYVGGDEFSAQEDVRNYDQILNDDIVGSAENNLEWGNDIVALRWNHLFNGKLFSNTTLTFSRYQVFARNYFESAFFFDEALEEAVEGFEFLSIASDIQDYTAKTDFDWLPNNRHHIRFGGGLTSHTIVGGQNYIIPDDIDDLDEIDIDDLELDSILAYEDDEFSMEALEWYGYLEDEIQFSKNWRANIGLRASAFFTDDQNWFHLEPRLNTSYAFSDQVSIQASLSKMVQYLHLISYSGFGLPGDLWAISFPELPPQISWQTTLGATFRSANQWTASVEGYYKKMNNLVFFPSEYQINEDSTGFGGGDDLVTGKGWGYGLEFLLKKEYGKTNGWLSYSYSFAERESSGVNFGKRYPFRHDRRQKINLVLFHRVNDWLELGTNFVFGTANPALIAQGDILSGEIMPYELVPGEKNKLRAGSYFRWDAGTNFNFGKNRLKHILKLSVYNLLNRKNTVYFSGFEMEEDYTELFDSVHILGIRPSLSYSLRF